MKLKTLEEMEWSDKKINESLIEHMGRFAMSEEELKANPLPEKGKHVDSLELRNEAIKWVRRLKLDHPYETNDEIFTMDQYIKGQIDWIMNFFNLSEADLK